MKVWVLLLWLLLLHPLVSNAADMCHGSSCYRLIGKDRSDANLTAGVMDICDGFYWRAVCHHHNYNERTAKVMCRQLGFPEGGQEYFHYGSWVGDGGYHFTCLGNETNLMQCQHILNTGRGCNRGGVACRTVVTKTRWITSPTTATHHLIKTVTQREQCTPQVVPSLTQQSLCTHAPTGHVTETTGHVTEATGHVTEATGQAAKKILERVNNCSALTGGLCIVTAAMAFGLVGMVSLWVRSCYRRASLKKRIRPLKLAKQKTAPTCDIKNDCLSPEWRAKGNFRSREKVETSDALSEPHFIVQDTSLSTPGMSTNHTVDETAPACDIIKNDGLPAEQISPEQQQEENFQTVIEKEEREGETFDISSQSHPTVQNISLDNEDISKNQAIEETAPPYDIDSPTTEQEGERNYQVRGKEDERERETSDDSPQSHPTVQDTSLGTPGMPTDEETAPPYDIDGPSTKQEGERNYQVRGKEDEREREISDDFSAGNFPERQGKGIFKKLKDEEERVSDASSPETTITLSSGYSNI